MKTYSSKSNARRAATKAGLELDTLTFRQDNEGKWFWHEAAELASDIEETREEPIIGEFVECPCCGIHLDNGVMDNLEWFHEKLQEVKRKQIGWKEAQKVVDEYVATGKSGQYCCLGCGNNFGPEVEFKLSGKKSTSGQATGNGLKIEKNREERNGIKRPSVGGKCRAVWDLCDKIYADTGIIPVPSIIKEEAAHLGLNANNAVIEMYQWRKFMGFVGRK